MSKQILNICSNFQQTIFHPRSTVVIHLQVYFCPTPTPTPWGSLNLHKLSTNMESNVSFPCWQVCIFSTSWVNSIRYCPCWPVFSRSTWTLFSHSHPRFPNHFFPWAFPTKMSWCILQACLLKATKRYYLRRYRAFVLLSIACLFILLSDKHNYIDILY